MRIWFDSHASNISFYFDVLINDAAVTTTAVEKNTKIHSFCVLIVQSASFFNAHFKLVSRVSKMLDPWSPRRPNCMRILEIFSFASNIYLVYGMRVCVGWMENQCSSFNRTDYTDLMSVPASVCSVSRCHRHHDCYQLGFNWIQLVSVFRFNDYHPKQQKKYKANE